MASRGIQYFPSIFDVRDIESAKAIILTDEGPGADTMRRWALETPYVSALIAEQLSLKQGDLLLDYGCGVGRLARPLIEQTGCDVIGVDISASMRALASTYVNDERFTCVSPAQFDALVAKGLRVDATIAVWVLQHCLEPTEDVARIWRGLRPDGRAFILNMRQRAVPTVEAGDRVSHFHWVTDGKDVSAILRDSFAVDAEGEVDVDVVPNTADAGSFWVRLVRASHGSEYKREELAMTRAGGAQVSGAHAAARHISGTGEPDNA
jgi:SAM-dependent methyltransferase